MYEAYTQQYVVWWDTVQAKSWDYWKPLRPRDVFLVPSVSFEQPWLVLCDWIGDRQRWWYVEIYCCCTWFGLILGITGSIKLPNDESCGIKFPNDVLLATSMACRCVVESIWGDSIGLVELGVPLLFELLTLVCDENNKGQIF